MLFYKRSNKLGIIYNYQFLSYYIAFIVDFLIVDLLLIVIQRYLGTDIRKKLKKRIKEAKNIQNLKE